MSVYKIEFSPQQFIEKSQKISDISHIEDKEIIEPLERLLWSLNNEAELVNNSATAIEKIYTHLGMTLTGRARRAMHQWEQANRQHHHGVHKYNLEDYGLSREEINEKCATYIERYQQYF